MIGASGPSITQTMNETSKYRNAANKVGLCPDFQKLFGMLQSSP